MDTENAADIVNGLRHLFAQSARQHEGLEGILGQIAASLADIADEQKRTADALNRMANSNFGLAKDLRRWFGDKWTQPALRPMDAPATDQPEQQGADNRRDCCGSTWVGEEAWFYHVWDKHPEWAEQNGWRRPEVAS